MNTLKELCEKIELPLEVTDRILLLQQSLLPQIEAASLKKLMEESSWQQGTEEIKEQIGRQMEDEDGMAMLCCHLACALLTREKYEERRISEEIYVETMKCFSRFVREHQESFCSYGFDRGFWTVRQLSGLLFRIGELEYEMTGAEEKAVELHIPSDAVLEKERIKESLVRAEAFLKEKFPDYEGVKWLCHSWLMSPSLSRVLPGGSRILEFQKLFALKETGEEEKDFMVWVYRREDIPVSRLPEETSLQRNLKRYLLAGGRLEKAVGIFGGVPEGAGAFVRAGCGQH